MTLSLQYYEDQSVWEEVSYSASHDMLNMSHLPILEPNTQPAESQGGESAELTAVPMMPVFLQYQGETMEPGHSDSANSECQYLWYHCPVGEAQIPPLPQYPYQLHQWPAAYDQPAPQYSYEPYDNILVERMPDSFGLIRSRARALHGEDLNLTDLSNVSAATSADKAAAPESTRRPESTHPSIYIPRTRPCDGQKQANKPYVKKPPNAFMLYLKEQRLSVSDELTFQGSSMVNKALAQRWKSLTEKEQAPYYKEAQEEKMLHVQQHPEWSNRENYGKMIKRVRRVWRHPYRLELHHVVIESRSELQDA